MKYVTYRHAYKNGRQHTTRKEWDTLEAAMKYTLRYTSENLIDLDCYAVTEGGNSAFDIMIYSYYAFTARNFEFHFKDAYSFCKEIEFKVTDVVSYYEAEAVLLELEENTNLEASRSEAVKAALTAVKAALEAKAEELEIKYAELPADVELSDEAQALYTLDCNENPTSDNGGNWGTVVKLSEILCDGADPFGWTGKPADTVAGEMLRALIWLNKSFREQGEKIMSGYSGSNRSFQYLVDMAKGLERPTLSMTLKNLTSVVDGNDVAYRVILRFITSEVLFLLKDHLELMFEMNEDRISKHKPKGKEWEEYDAA